MAGWQDNTIMLWAGTEVTDHGRSPLSQTSTRIGADKRMADGTFRRQHIGIKRTWSVDWQNIPSINTSPTGMKTVDGGMSGKQMEDFYLATPGKFRMVLKKGTALNQSTPAPAESALPYEDANFYVCNVMITDFSKEVVKRGNSDLWNLSVTLEEV